MSTEGVWGIFRRDDTDAQPHQPLSARVMHDAPGGRHHVQPELRRRLARTDTETAESAHFWTWCFLSLSTVRLRSIDLQKDSSRSLYQR